MELLGKRQNTELALKSSEPWAIAIKGQFGEFENFAERFKPTAIVQHTCYTGIARAVRMGDSMPSLIRAQLTYGRENIIILLETHISRMLVTMGAEGKLDAVSVGLLARTIADSPRLRTLKFSTVLGFFAALQSGEYKLYGINNYEIMRSFKEYAEKAHEIESAERFRIDDEERKRKESESEGDWQKWEVTRQKLGLPPGTTYVDWVLMDVEKEKKAQAEAERKAYEEQKKKFLKEVELEKKKRK